MALAKPLLFSDYFQIEGAGFECEPRWARFPLFLVIAPLFSPGCPIGAEFCDFLPIFSFQVFFFSYRRILSLPTLKSPESRHPSANRGPTSTPSPPDMLRRSNRFRDCDLILAVPFPTGGGDIAPALLPCSVWYTKRSLRLVFLALAENTLFLSPFVRLRTGGSRLLFSRPA